KTTFLSNSSDSLWGTTLISVSQEDPTSVSSKSLNSPLRWNFGATNREIPFLRGAQ
ncbi:hypothetical protein STEG23_031134, partial [Scotinomys teguina]